HDPVAAVQTGNPERALNRLGNGSRVDHHRTVRFHPGVVVRINRAGVGGIHESAIDHVICVVAEPVVGSGVGAPGGGEFDRAVFIARAAAGLDHDFEGHDL